MCVGWHCGQWSFFQNLLSHCHSVNATLCSCLTNVPLCCNAMSTYWICTVRCDSMCGIKMCLSSKCFIQWPQMPLFTHTWCIRTRLERFHFSVWWECVWACSLYVCIGFPWISVLIEWSAGTTDMGTVFQSTLSTSWCHHPSHYLSYLRNRVEVKYCSLPWVIKYGLNFMIFDFSVW